MALGYEILKLSQFEAMIVSGLLFSFFLSMELARTLFPQLNQMLIKFWSPFIRSHEVTQKSGMFYFSAGAFFISILFAKPIVMLSLLYLSVGDPLASLFGIMFKSVIKLRVRSGKSLIGTTTMFLACWLMTYFLLSNAGVDYKYIIWIAGIGSFTASVSELMCPDILPMDDNFLIPVTSAISLWIGFKIFGINPYHLHLFTSSIRLR